MSRWAGRGRGAADGAANVDRARTDRGAVAAAPSRRARAAALAALALIAVAAAPGDAAAQRKRPPTAAPSVDAQAIAQKVRSLDPAQVLEALGAARDAGADAAPAAPAIEALLGRGATVPVAKAAIEALGAIGQVTSSAALRPYAKHRIPELRRGAIKALLRTGGAEALAAFEEGLRSSDGILRGDSASGLGSLRATAALPDLFVALERDVPEATGAIGQLCDQASCRRLVGLLGKVAFDVMTSGIDPILFRQDPLPDDLLLEIVGQLRDLGTPEAGRYLADVEARWPATGSQAVKQAVQAAVSSIPGARP